MNCQILPGESFQPARASVLLTLQCCSFLLCPHLNSVFFLYLPLKVSKDEEIFSLLEECISLIVAQALFRPFCSIAFNPTTLLSASLLRALGTCYSNLCSYVCRQNPTWRSLDFGMLPDLLDTSASCFVVRIWGGQEEKYTLLLEWKVNLDGLRYTGQQVSNGGVFIFKH